MRTGLSIVLVAGVTLASSCGSTVASEPDDRVDVVASFAPLTEAAMIVGDDHVTVTDLTPPGVEPHDLELTPGDLEALGSADLVVYLGGGFQPAVEDAIPQAGGEVLDALGDPSELPTTEDEHGDEVPDPHVWLSPLAYAEVVGRVASALASVDPANEDSYFASASAYQEDLAELDADLTVGLSGCDSDLLVTGHEAFGYLASAYGLRQIGVTGVSPEAEPTPQHLAEVRELVLNEGVTTVFAEEQLPPDSVEAIARETGAEVAVLDTLESAGEGSYEDRMRDNLEVLRGALGCD
jgi:zinc transport system substrate-binding protein